MPVYMIRAGEHGPVKIGFTNDLAKRLVELQVGNHERLSVLRLFDGGAAEEARLHERFAENWLHGEWHGFSNAMLTPDLLGLRDVLQKPSPIQPTAGLDDRERKVCPLGSDCHCARATRESLARALKSLEARQRQC